MAAYKKQKNVLEHKSCI